MRLAHSRTLHQNAPLLNYHHSATCTHPAPSPGDSPQITVQPYGCGRGPTYASRTAARAVVRFAFTRLAAAALFAGHHPDNTASAGVLTKLGFCLTHTELYPPTGLHHPSYWLSADSQH